MITIRHMLIAVINTDDLLLYFIVTIFLVMTHEFSAGGELASRNLKFLQTETKNISISSQKSKLTSLVF